MPLLRRFMRRKKETPETHPQPLPPGTYVLSLEVKSDYHDVPFHVFYPTPFDKITVLKHRQRAHYWFVPGWYIGPFEEGGVIRGQIYKPLVEDKDKEFVLYHVRTQDRDANVHFSVEGT